MYRQTGLLRLNQVCLWFRKRWRTEENGRKAERNGKSRSTAKDGEVAAAWGDEDRERGADVLLVLRVLLTLSSKQGYF